MDYYEDGVKQANAGFVKFMQWRKQANAEYGEQTCMQIHISQFPVMEGMKGTVKLLGGKQEIILGQVMIQSGKGMLRIEDLNQEFAKAGILNEQGRVMIRIEFAAGRSMECVLFHKEEPEAETVMVEAAEMETSNETVPDAPDVPGDSEAINESREMVRMQHDKWRQLETVFAHIRPFDDKREYLQLELKDLIVLSNMHYHLAENSFLLHGYFNYGHLILTKMYKRGGEKIYVGVPGNYYEKEAQVAVMFGFESFEPKTEPPLEGDFGYYMIGVGI